MSRSVASGPHSGTTLPIARVVSTVRHAVLRTASTELSHGAIWFQLALFWSTILRSRELTPKCEFRLGEPREGCRAEAAKPRRRACPVLSANELRLGYP